MTDLHLGRFTLSLVDLGIAASVLLGSLGLTRLMHRALTRLSQTQDVSMRATYYSVARVAQYLILISGGLFALGVLGVDLSKITLLVSAIGVGLGFGMQQLIGNFVAGLIILFERHLKVGDYVELASGTTGTVREINLRATRVTTNDNIDVLVPNSEFVNGRVLNWTLSDINKRMRVKFGVAYGSDKSQVRQVVTDAALRLVSTRDDGIYKPQVWLTGFGASALEFELVVWLRPEAVGRPASTQADYCWAIDDALRSAGIELPFPQQDVRLRSLFGLEGDAARQFLHAAVAVQAVAPAAAAATPTVTAAPESRPSVDPQ